MKNSLFRTIITGVLLWLAFAAPCPMERECFAAGKVVRVGFFEFPGYHMRDAKGQFSGYGYDYLYNLADWTDWTYEYVGFDRSWNDMLRMLERGDIDLVTSARKTPERTAKFLFSDEAIGISWTVLVSNANDTRFHTNNFKEMNGIRVGMLVGNSRNSSFAKFAKEHNFSFVPVYFDGPDSAGDMAAALRYGKKIDAILTSNLRVVSNNERVLARFDPEPFYIITRRDSKELMDEINEATRKLAVNNPTLVTNLTEKYYAPRGGEFVALTAEEGAYVKSLKESGARLKGIMKPNRFPLSDFDANGKPIGIIADIMALVSDYVGVPIDIVNPGSEEAYETFELNRDIPLKLDTGVYYTDADAGDFRFTRPYLPVSIMGIGKTHVIERNDRVAALRFSRITNKFVSAKFSPSQIVYYDTPEQCLNAVRSGAVKLTFFDRYSAEKFVMDDYSGELKLYTVMDFSADLAIAVSRSMPPELRSVLSKAILSIHSSELEHIVITNNSYPARRITIYDVFDKYKIAIIVIACLFVLCICLLAALIVRERALLKTRARAMALNSELEDINKLLARQATTDELTGLYNRRFFVDYTDNLLGRLTADDKFAMIMFDLDNFKSVNDVYGHLAGNQVLIDFADILHGFCSSRILAIRYGGEEFMMLIQGMTSEEVMATAEKIRLTTQEKLCVQGTDVFVTVSGGVAIWEHGKDRTDLIAESDRKMYVAKNRGKNRIAS